jgi:hypothetical protein
MKGMKDNIGSRGRSSGKRKERVPKYQIGDDGVVEGKER